MIRVAILGCGYWGGNLLRNLSEDPSFRVVACADIDSSRLEHLGRRYPETRLTTDIDEVLHGKDVDAVVISTPAESHYANARDALKHGKHVLIEKPMTTSVEDAETLVWLADSMGLTLMVDHTFVYTGAVRKIREIVSQDELGDIHYFDSVRINLGLFRHDVNVLWDLAPHDLSIMDYVLGKRPVAVSASGGSHISSRVLDVAYLSVYFDDSTLAHFHCNWLAPVKVRTIIVGGSKRLVLYDDTEASEKVKIYDRGIDGCKSGDLDRTLVQYRLGDMYAPNLDTREALGRCCEHFAECINARREPITGGIEGLTIVRILAAAERSIVEDSRKVPL